MKKILLATLLIITNVHNALSQEISSLTPAQAQAKVQQDAAAVKTVSDALFNPMISGDTPKPNPYPLDSLNAKAIDATFGSGGLAVDATTLQHIKNFYFYLEYIVKLELGAAIATYAQQKSIDVVTILESATGWQELIKQATQIAGGWNQLLTAASTIAPRFDLIQGTINAPTWQEILTTPFWKSIIITPDLIAQSSFWQKYLKYTVTKTFDQDGMLVGSIANAEKRIFPYIPNIEVAYYNADFTYLRTASEYFRLTLLINDEVRSRSIMQCIDWKKNINATTGQIDLIKTYSAVQAFKQDSWYQLLNVANQSLTTLAQQAAASTPQLPIPNASYAQDPMVQSELTCIAMLKNIQGQLNYLFRKPQLETIIKLLANTAIAKPSPSLFLYKPEDYLYLEDLATILDSFENADPATIDPNSKNISLGGAGNETVTVQDFSSWLSDKWNEVKDQGVQAWSDVQKTGKDVGGTALDVWQGIEDEAKAIGFRGAALGTILAGDPQDAKKFLQKSAELQNKVAKDLKETLSDAETLLDDTAAAAKDSSAILGEISGIAIAGITQNTALGDLFEKSINSGIELAVDQLIALGGILLEETGGLLYLTADAIAITIDVTTKSIMDVARRNWGALGQDVLNGLETYVADVATTLWNSVTFVGKYFVDTLMKAIALIGYLTALITETIVSVSTDILQGFAAMVDSLGWQGAKDALNSATQQIEAHKQTISTTVTTVLIVGSVFLTDGAALPLLAFCVGPQLFQVEGSYKQDEQTEALAAEQEQFLNNYQQFVTNNKTISTNLIEASSAELNLKNNAQIINEERALGFYQNFLVQYFESTKQQMSSYLGSFLAPQIQPDEKYYNLRFADVGSTYGFQTGDGTQTGVLNLNPSQGFPLYNKGRNLFSQEIAVYPTIATQDDKEVIRKFWFNQKETIPLTDQTTDIEVRWQAIYVLNNFYLGLYFGGEAYDLTTIKDTKIAPIDAGHLAKMLVYKKEDTNAPVTLSLYEHEGKGWFTENLNGPAFEIGSWYRMKMQLNTTTLSVKVWKETDNEPTTWQTFTVEETPQKTMGIISSGASIQYEIITPKIAITPTDARGDITWQTEKERSIAAQQILQQKMSPPQCLPPLGSIPLQAVGKPQILKGQFIYNTKDNDYVVLGTFGSGQTIINQGISPRDLSSTKPAVVSLISGAAFDANGNKATPCANVLDQFLQVHGPLSDALTTKLKSTRDEYVNSMLGPFTFGQLALKATGAQEIIQSQYIYQATPSPEKELNGGTDYFLLLGSDNKLGAPYDKNIQYIQSLVTGLRYDKNGNKDTVHYFAGKQALDYYASKIGTLRTELYNSIIATATTYATNVKQEGTPQSLDLNPVQPSNSAPQSGPQKDTTSTFTAEVTPAKDSMEQRTQDAASDGWGWQ